ncbi:metallophosphoesterase [Nonomuraea rosea]|uniref:Metallophosphoesterase n=1 Tax=Nonomuraea rosea TaxID=638574 RepID=A0ABP6ZHR9_9ACTN
MVLLAHISDLHVGSSDQSADRVRAIVSYLLGLARPVDAVVVTGDLAAKGTDEEYETLRYLLGPLKSLILCPGNHDHRSTLRNAMGFVSPDNDGPFNQWHRLDGAVVITCDSTIPGRDEGEMSSDTLTWLDATLDAARDVPALVCMHHPPTPLHIPSFDVLGLRNPDALATVVQRHDNVVGILCGHAHSASAARFHGIPVLVAPGVESTAILPWESHYDRMKDEKAPPGIAFHVLRDGKLATHFRVITS